MPILGDRYELGALLGAGGMADVYEANDLRLARRVAVKVLRPDVSDQVSRQRFEREARSLATFMHPNAVAVYDASESNGRPYIVMEFVDGSTLASQIAERHPFTIEDVRHVGDQILAALEALHGRGIVHRDVKPANVLISVDGPAKLADFGIAKAFTDATADLTMTGQVVGTVKYLAPEVAAGRPATPQSDLYAVGVLLDEMLSATRAYRVSAPDASTQPMESATARTVPSSLMARSLGTAIERSRQSDPTRRFATAHEMRTALNEALDTPTAKMETAHHDHEPARAHRPPRRHVVLVAVLAAIVGVFVTVLAASFGTASAPPHSAATVPEHPSAATATDHTATSTVSTSPANAGATQPQTLQQLVALLGAQTDAFGSKAHDLRDRLEQVLDERTGRAHKTTSRLIADINNWTSQGQLDPAIGATATRLLNATTSRPQRDNSDD